MSDKLKNAAEDAADSAKRAGNDARSSAGDRRTGGNDAADDVKQTFGGMNSNSGADDAARSATDRVGGSSRQGLGELTGGGGMSIGAIILLVVIVIVLFLIFR